jgi:hypothetical protein
LSPELMLMAVAIAASSRPSPASSNSRWQWDTHSATVSGTIEQNEPELRKSSAPDVGRGGIKNQRGRRRAHYQSLSSPTLPPPPPSLPQVASVDGYKTAPSGIQAARPSAIGRWQCGLLKCKVAWSRWTQTTAVACFSKYTVCLFEGSLFFHPPRCISRNHLVILPNVEG